MGMEIYLIPAGIGDCILIRCGEEKKKVNILIDSGQGTRTFTNALKKIETNHEKIDMLVLTHDDNDHVKGACNLLERLFCSRKTQKILSVGKILEELTEERILFNFGGNDTEVLLKAEDVKKLSENMKGKIDFHKLGFVLSDEEERAGVPYPNMIQIRWECREEVLKSEIIRKPTEEDLNTEKEHLEIIILSPKRETLLQYIDNAWKKLNSSEVALIAIESKNRLEWNKSIQYWFSNPMKAGADEKLANRASIAFMIRYHGIYTLFAGDASADDMVAAGRTYLKRSGQAEEYLDVGLIKLPHHGSSYNISQEFFHFFRTKTYLISTCGHAGYQHPGKKTLATIAETLNEGERAEIFSSYSWWREKEAFCQAERREKNWDNTGNICELKDVEGEKRYLQFHKLEKTLYSVHPEIMISQ